jgi:NADH:ubiquinone oxidoreductase subunit 2 (subunit N)
VNNILYFSTEVFLAFSLCFLLIYSVFYDNNKLIRNVFFVLIFSILINTSLLIKFISSSETQLVLMNNFTIDTYTLCAKTFILFLAIISTYILKTITTKEINEFIIIFGFSINAALFLLSSFN